LFTRRILLTILVTAAVAALAASTASAAVSGISAWRESGAQNLGAMPARGLSITFSLAARNASALRTFISAPHAALTRTQFSSRFGPSAKTVNSVRTWAKAHKLKVSSVSANRLLVHITGSSTSIGRALGTRFESFRTGSGARFFGLAGPARLPKAFASKLTAVLGLSSLAKVPLTLPTRRSAAGLNKVLGTVAGLPPLLGLGASSLSYPSEYAPQGFWSMYNAPASQTGSGQPLAIITEGDVSQPKKDLVTFEQKYGLPSVTWNQINIGTPSTDTSGDDEWDLDSQYSTGFAPGAGTLDVYVAPSMSDQDITTAINRWVTDDASKQGSFSAGECELLAYAAGFTSSLDTVLEQADAQGQTMFFSSGDTGSQCPAVVGVNGVPAGIPGVNYPASSPYGIGVGGTTVLSPAGPTEIAWYAGGGGSSLLEPTPSFQSSTKLAGAAPLLRRGVPDVSLDADPESGYDVVVNGAVQVIGGTSASTPSWQGIWARAQAAHGGSLGFAGPVIYGKEPAAAFHDITLGANGFLALPGWDYATGRGTPDIAQFIAGA
jgi:pseudomonalisin